MAKIMTAYKWEKGEIVEYQMSKTEAKFNNAYFDIEELLLSMVKLKRYHLQNELYQVLKRVEEINKIEAELEKVGICMPKISQTGLEKNSDNLSLDMINEVIDTLNELKAQTTETR